MNFYNPYSVYPSMLATPARQGLFSSLTNGMRGINWGNLLNNTQRTLNIINQAIPAVKQISPMVRNVKTMFRVMNEFNRTDTPQQSTSITSSQSLPKQEIIKKVENSQQGPTFFL